MKFISIFVVFYLIFILSFNVNAEVHAGIIKNTKSLYSFVSHFCYSKGQRFLNVTAFTTTNNGQKLGLMNKQSWDSLNNKMTCTEIESKTIQQFTIENNKNQLFAVNIDSISWWYLVGYNCNPDLSFSYEVTWTDGNGFWEKQFSYDEQGLGQLYICFTVFYFIALGIHIYGCVKLQAEKSYHQIVKMVTIAFSVELFAQMMLSIHYGVYARNGEGIFSFLFIGQILDLTGDLLMILSVTLIAQGYAKNSMSIQQQKITFIILAVNLVIYVAMDIWKISGNRSSVNYLYDTAPGGIILTIRMLLFVYFLFAIINTIKEEQIQKKINFYVKFAVFTGVWFVFLPICALIALGMPSYSRLVFISAILVTIDYIGFVGLGVLMWPTFIHNFFVVKQVNVVDFSESEDLNEEDPL